MFSGGGRPRQEQRSEVQQSETKIFKSSSNGFWRFSDSGGGHERATASAAKINFFLLKQVHYDGENKVFARVCAVVVATTEAGNLNNANLEVRVFHVGGGKQDRNTSTYLCHTDAGL